MQIENEYGFCGQADPDYLRHLVAKVPLWPGPCAPACTGTRPVHRAAALLLSLLRCSQRPPRAAQVRQHLGPDVLIYTTDPADVLDIGTLPGDEVYSCASWQLLAAAACCLC